MQSTGSNLKARMHGSNMSLSSLGITPLAAIKQQAMKLNDVYVQSKLHNFDEKYVLGEKLGEG